MKKLKPTLKNTAFLHPEYFNEFENDSELLDERCGDGQGTFRWVDYKNKTWFTNNLNNPEFLFFNGVYYKYGKDGCNKVGLYDLKENEPW
jgi:hypothetical protein